MRKRPRTFNRDEYLGVRLPREDKDRLREVARKRRRDLSSLAIQYMVEGLTRDERELQKAVVPGL